MLPTCTFSKLCRAGGAVYNEDGLKTTRKQNRFDGHLLEVCRRYMR